MVFFEPPIVSVMSNYFLSHVVPFPGVTRYYCKNSAQNHLINFNLHLNDLVTIMITGLNQIKYLNVTLIVRQKSLRLA